MPAARFFNLAMRLPFYQGTLTYRVMEANEEPAQPSRTQTASPRINHNTAAAKAAGLKEGEQITMVPFSVLIAQHGDLGEYSKG